MKKSAILLKAAIKGPERRGYPTGIKWKQALILHHPRATLYVMQKRAIGAFTDRTMLESDPHRLIEGIAIALTQSVLTMQSYSQKWIRACPVEASEGY